MLPHALLRLLSFWRQTLVLLPGSVPLLRHGGGVWPLAGLPRPEPPTPHGLWRLTERYLCASFCWSSANTFQDIMKCKPREVKMGAVCPRQMRACTQPRSPERSRAWLESPGVSVMLSRGESPTPGILDSCASLLPLPPPAGCEGAPWCPPHPIHTIRPQGHS